MMRSTHCWHVVSIKGGDAGGGVTSHRGVLHPDEYVDKSRLLVEVERRLGFTSAELRKVYVQGRKSRAQRELRARIDRRLHEVADAGGNLAALARVLDVDPKTFSRAVGRARVTSTPWNLSTLTPT